VYYIDAVRDLLIPLLFLFSLIKFTLVVLWFMHLKFDSRTYARFFVLGLAGAITLYLIVLLTFRVFGG
jgi:cytochrome c oxidase subunit IV